VASQPNWIAGVIDCDAADKVARSAVLRLFNIPIVHVPRYPAVHDRMREEWRGILRHRREDALRYIDARSQDHVLVRKSFAGAYLACRARDTGADMVFAWPMQGHDRRSRDRGERDLCQGDPGGQESGGGAAQRCRSSRRSTKPYRGAERGYIDDVILPARPADDLPRVGDSEEQGGGPAVPEVLEHHL